MPMLMPMPMPMSMHMPMACAHGRLHANKMCMCVRLGIHMARCCFVLVFARPQLFFVPKVVAAKLPLVPANKIRHPKQYRNGSLVLKGAPMSVHRDNRKVEPMRPSQARELVDTRVYEASIREGRSIEEAVRAGQAKAREQLASLSASTSLWCFSLLKGIA